MNAYRKKFGMIGQFPLITNLYGEHDVFGEYRSHVVAALIKKFADAVQSRARQVALLGHRSARCASSSTSATPPKASSDLLESCYPEPLNVGTGIGTSIKELAELVARFTGFTGRNRLGCQQARWRRSQGARRDAA